MKRRRRAPRAKRKTRQAAPADVMTIAAFARDRHVDEKAVRKGITSGRIPSALVGRSRTGRRPVILDVEAARAAWEANASRLPTAGKNGITTPLLPGAPAVDGERQSLSEASRQATMERFRKLRIENDLREGRVVDVRAAKREAFDSYRIIRETLLNLPARIAAELAAETDPGKVFARLDDAIREALHETADRLEAAGE